MQLGSHIALGVAVMQAGSCSLDLTPSLETFIRRGCGPKNTKKKKKKKKDADHISIYLKSIFSSKYLLTCQKLKNKTKQSKKT